MEKEEALALLETTQAVLKVEKTLTASLELAQPWLHGAIQNPHRPRVRPIPSTMDDVKAVLASARHLGARTSAPAGWNPAANVIGFSTPNPLPHQLRGGALATLQLERAKLQQQKRQKLQQEQQKEAAALKVKQDKEPTQQQQQNQQQQQQQQQNGDRPPNSGVHQQQQQRQARPKQEISMNLSDSSSSEEDDDGMEEG